MYCAHGFVFRKSWSISNVSYPESHETLSFAGQRIPENRGADPHVPHWNSMK